jgi:hypothetical protein
VLLHASGNDHSQNRPIDRKEPERRSAASTLPAQIAPLIACKGRERLSMPIYPEHGSGIPRAVGRSSPCTQGNLNLVRHKLRARRESRPCMQRSLNRVQLLFPFLPVPGRGFLLRVGPPILKQNPTTCLESTLIRHGWPIFLRFSLGLLARHPKVRYAVFCEHILLGQCCARLFLRLDSHFNQPFY